MNMNFLVRLHVALVSSIIFALINSIYIMIMWWDSTYFDSIYFIGFFIGFLMYGTPAMIVIGIPFSYLIDIMVTKLKFNNKSVFYMTRISLYAIAGFIGTWLLVVVLNRGKLNISIFNEYFTFAISGIVAALVYFFLLQLISLVMDKFKQVYTTRKESVIRDD